MMNDAKSHSAEDKKKREEVEIRNQADQLVYQTEKNLKEYGDKVDGESKGKIEAAMGRVREALKTSDTNEMRSAKEALDQVWQEAASKMYASAQPQPGGQPGGPSPGPDAGQAGASGSAQGGPGGDGKVQDADFEVVDENKS
jgi:molecular chaperone DnaK